MGLRLAVGGAEDRTSGTLYAGAPELTEEARTARGIALFPSSAVRSVAQSLISFYELPHRRHSSTDAWRGSARPNHWSPPGADRAALPPSRGVSDVDLLRRHRGRQVVDAIHNLSELTRRDCCPG
jgi:hypothetical protein